MENTGFRFEHGSGFEKDGRSREHLSLPNTMVETIKTMVETTNTMVGTPKTMVGTTNTMVKTTKTMVKTTKTMVKATKTMVETTNDHGRKLRRFYNLSISI